MTTPDADERAGRRPRAAIYARVSHDPAGAGGSVDRQVAACRRLAELREWDVVVVLEDTALSAYTGQLRPGWLQALALVEAGQVDVVVAWHFDRMTRSVSDLEQLILLAEERGVVIATVAGDMDLSTDTGRMVARILAAVARAEVERKAQRQRLANEQAAREGMPHRGGTRPFGYAQDHMTLVPREAEAFRTAALDVLSDASLGEIASAWHRAGLASSRSKTRGWTVPGVRQLLLNPRYAGLRSYQGEVVGPGAWPAILDLQVHYELRARLTARTSAERGRRPSTLLSGIASARFAVAPSRAPVRVVALDTPARTALVCWSRVTSLISS